MSSLLVVGADGRAGDGGGVTVVLTLAVVILEL